MPLKPRRDENGVVIPHDDPDILPEHGIIRRVSEELLVNDEKLGGRRISTFAFNPSSGVNGGLSVDLQNEIEEAGLDAKAYVTTPQWVGSVRIEAQLLRDEGFIIGSDPIESNPYHGEVWGLFTKGKRRRLLAMCEWFVQIEGVAIDK